MESPRFYLDWFSGVRPISVKKGKVVLVRNYILDLEVHNKAWGEVAQ